MLNWGLFVRSCVVTAASVCCCDGDLEGFGVIWLGLGALWGS